MVASNPLEEIEQKLHQQPWYVWAGALTGGGIVFIYVMKRRATQAAATQTATVPANTANGNVNGYQVADMAGLPYGTQGYTADSGNPVDNYPTAPSGNLGPTAPTPTSSGQQGALVRPRFNSNTTNAYDQKFAQGVPIHAQANANSQVVGYAAYASQVSITGAPVGGSSNFGKGNTKGSGLWFPVANGYISGYDLVGFFTLPAMGSGGLSFQDFLNHGNRNTIDQHASVFNLGA